MSDLSKPNTKDEVYMAAASGNLGSDTPLPEPRTKAQEYLKAIAERIGEESADLTELGEKVLENSADIDDLQGRTSELENKVELLVKKETKIYGFRINPNEADPYEAVVYLADAVGMTPAKMGAESFDYGSWRDAFFMPRPCMVKYDGTVDYYLNPDNYKETEDCSASDVANSD